MQDENNKPFFPDLGSFNPYPFLVPSLSGQGPEYFLEQPALSSPSEQSLYTLQDQINQYNINFLTNSMMVTGQVTPPIPAPQFDPLMSLYFPNHTQILSGQYSGYPSSPLEEAIVSDYIQYPSSPAPTPATARASQTPPSSSASTSSSISPSLPPLPKPVTKSCPVKTKSSTSAKRTLESTTFDDDYEDDPIRPGEDMAARKRRQNTMAARRSRMRKVAKMSELEQTVSTLEKDKIQLETRLAVMESEKEMANTRLRESLDRIRALEAQLLEAYKSRS